MQLSLSNQRRPAWRAAFFFAATGFCAGMCTAQDEDLAALSRAARRLMSEGHFEQAIPVYEQLVKSVPGNSGLILNLGLAEEMAGHPEKAIPRFEEVLKAEPGNMLALNSLARSHLELNQPRLALAPLKKLVTLQPSNRGARE